MGPDPENHWLDRRRVLTYSLVFALVFLILTIGVVAHSNLVKSDGGPLWFDFAVFWSASKLSLLGHPGDAYDLSRLHAVLQGLHPEIREGSYGWFYPPSYLLLVSPLALLPFIPSYLVFMAVSFTAYAFVVRQTCPRPETLWVLMGFSGVWDSFLTGQNGFLTAALAGGALLVLEKKPLTAGLLAGLLAIKPQLALLFPVAFLASGSWKALLGMAASALASLLLSAWVLGFGTLASWADSLGLAKKFLEIGGTEYWLRMPTVFSAAHLAGMPIPLSYALQLLVACGAAACVWTVWRHCGRRSLRNASLVAGSLLVSPYVQIYDLTWLALAGAWLIRDAIDWGWLRYEREALPALWLLPAAMLAMARIAPFQIGPWGLLLLLAMLMRRASLAGRGHGYA